MASVPDRVPLRGSTVTAVRSDDAAPIPHQRYRGRFALCRGRLRVVADQGSGPPAAIAESVANSSPLSEAPPTSAPSMSGAAISSPTFLALTEPP